MKHDKIDMKEFGLTVKALHDLASRAMLAHPDTTITALGVTRLNGKLFLWYNTPDNSTHMAGVTE